MLRFPGPHGTNSILTSCAAFCLLALLLAGCDTRESSSLGDAYVAPAQLTLLRELSSKSSNTAVLQHGDHVSIIDARRRFVKVRTSKGFEGWVDSAQLLSAGQMAELQKANARDRRLPSEGAATVFEPLNIHIEANRQSPALARIVEGESVAVLRHVITDRYSTPPRAPSLIKERPQPLRRRRERQTRSLRLPPPPPPPKPPANWQQLSAERASRSDSTAAMKARQDAEAAARKAEEARKPVKLEDWSLVRVKAGQTGWVLSRNLVMSIPDEVAQYAEGKHITSYFDLGTVDDSEKGPHHNWLWTTSNSQKPYDFDSWRVFLWNRRRHRYETSYRQRNVEGYFPVTVDPVDPSVFGRIFRIVTKDDDGTLRQRTYLFDGTRVHLVNTEAYRPDSGTQLDGSTSEDKAKQQNWIARQWLWLQQKFSRSAR